MGDVWAVFKGIFYCVGDFAVSPTLSATHHPGGSQISGILVFLYLDLDLVNSGIVTPLIAIIATST